jgi:hypothetical protein
MVMRSGHPASRNRKGTGSARVQIEAAGDGSFFFARGKA